MKIYTLSGIKNEAIRGRMIFIRKNLIKQDHKSFKAHILRNELFRLQGAAYKPIPDTFPMYEAYLIDQLQKYQGGGIIPQLISRELKMIRAGNFTGNLAYPVDGMNGFFKKFGKKFRRSIKKVGKFFKKLPKNLWQGLKKVTMSPARNAFLALVHLNFRGIASKMARHSQDKIGRKWGRFGGKKSTLIKAIKKGAKKRPFFGGSRGTGKQQIKGIGQRAIVSIEDYDDIYIPFNIDGTESEGINDGGMSLPAILALASSILAAFSQFLSTARKEPVDPNILNAEKEGGWFEQIKDTIQNANLDDIVDLAQQAGGALNLPPNFSVSDPEPQAEYYAGEPTGDPEIDNMPTSFKISTPVLMAGGLLAAALILTPKK